MSESSNPCELLCSGAELLDPKFADLGTGVVADTAVMPLVSCPRAPGRTARVSWEEMTRWDQGRCSDAAESRSLEQDEGKAAGRCRLSHILHAAVQRARRSSASRSSGRPARTLRCLAARSSPAEQTGILKDVFLSPLILILPVVSSPCRRQAFICGVQEVMVDEVFHIGAVGWAARKPRR